MTEEPTSNEKFIFEQVKDRYLAEHTRTQNLTTKASNLVGWVGLIISVVLAGGGVLFTASDREVKVSLNIIDIYLLIALLIALVGSLVVGLFAIRVKQYESAPESRRLIEKYSEAPHRETLKVVAVEYTLATEHNKRANESKAKQVTACWILFVIGMGLTASFIVVQFSKLLVNG